MKKFIKSDYFLVSISILVSIFLWIFVSYEVNPVYEIRVSDVKITYTNKNNDFKTGKLIVVGDMTVDADVVIRGDRGVISKYKGEDINCTVNLASISNPGTYVLPVSYSTNTYGVNVIEKNPTTVELVIDRVVTREFEISVQEKGKAADGFDVSSITAEPGMIRVTGPQTAVDKVSKARLNVDVTNAKSDITGLYKIKLYDTKGNEINNDQLRLDVEYCDVTCSVLPYKDVKVVANIGEGKNYVGNNVSVSKINPETIRIFGSKEKLNDIKYITTDAISVVNVYDKININAQLNLSKLPEDVIVENNITEVAIELVPVLEQNIVNSVVEGEI